jgi:SAM-dependent methyltransferase
MHRVDYDQVAHLYDEPVRDHKLDSNLASLVNARSTADEADLAILDVACGTGKQLMANRARFTRMAMVGLDRSAAMLGIVRRRCPEVTWVHGEGTQLPFPHSSFDYVSNQFAYPHIRDKETRLGEFLRGLKPAGRFVMTNIDPWRMPIWSLYRYFPEAGAIDERDFLKVNQFVALMGTVGFRHVDATHTEIPLSESLNEFLEFASSRHRCSQLMAISDQAYSAGLSRVEDAIRTAAEPEAPVESLVVLVTVSGDKSKSGPMARE